MSRSTNSEIKKHFAEQLVGQWVAESTVGFTLEQANDNIDILRLACIRFLGLEMGNQEVTFKARGLESTVPQQIEQIVESINFYKDQLVRSKEEGTTARLNLQSGEVEPPKNSTSNLH